jgi:hypothetical protein
MGRGPGSGETGDRRRLAPGGFSALLEVAITRAMRQICSLTFLPVLDYLCRVSFPEHPW